MTKRSMAFRCWVLGVRCWEMLRRLLCYSRLLDPSCSTDPTRSTRRRLTGINLTIHAGIVCIEGEHNRQEPLAQGGEQRMPRRTHFIGCMLGVLFALSTIGIRPAGAQSSTDVVLTVGRAFGSGNILVAPGQYASFRFQLDPETAGQSKLGQVQFVNRLTNERVISLRITSAFVIPGLVSVEGICTINGRP